jgi:hypothetical protein
MFTQELPFSLKTEIPREVDLRTIIFSAEIQYEGTAVEASFSFEDPTQVLLEVYDLEVIELQYSQVSDTVVRVTARAGNRAMPAGNFWFRIYPVFGGGTHEFPIVESFIDTLLTNQVVTLSGLFTPPSLDKSLEFIAIIDDGHDFYEIIESNNQLTTTFYATGNRDLSTGNDQVRIYPNPVRNEVYFNYKLEEACDQVRMSLYSVDGQLRFETLEFPAYAGDHQVVQRMDRLPAGSYFYRMEFLGGKGAFQRVSGILLKE